MTQKYRKYKNVDWKWECEACGISSRNMLRYNYFKGICIKCRKNTPEYIPEEQIVKWIKSKNM